MKDVLRHAFLEALAALAPVHAMAPVLTRFRARARAGDAFLVLAYGKAARGMASAVVERLPGATLRGLVVPPEPDAAPLAPFEVIAGGHPVPTAGSLRAAQRALELAASVRGDETVLFLASGGGSAMLEAPIDPAVTLDEVQTLHRALVACGAPILEVNTVRRHLSAVKGGRLAAAAAAAREHVTITINDLRWDMPSHVASGPSHVDPTSVADCVHVLDHHRLWPFVPERLHAPLRAGSLPRGLERTAARPPALAADVADNADARRAVQQHLRHTGIHVVRDVELDDRHLHEFPCEETVAVLAGELHALHRLHPGRTVAIVAGGELSVPLPEAPGAGGRNQQFALACARVIRGRPITVLSCGTDGIDGNSPAAGAIVDGTTMARARAAGFDVHDALRRCDAFPVLDALGDTVITGPTGTNVRDVRVLVHRG